MEEDSLCPSLLWNKFHCWGRILGAIEVRGKASDSFISDVIGLEHVAWMCNYMDFLTPPD